MNEVDWDFLVILLLFIPTVFTAALFFLHMCEMTVDSNSEKRGLPDRKEIKKGGPCAGPALGICR